MLFPGPAGFAGNHPAASGLDQGARLDKPDPKPLQDLKAAKDAELDAEFDRSDHDVATPGGTAADAQFDKEPGGERPDAAGDHPARAGEAPKAGESPAAEGRPAADGKSKTDFDLFLESYNGDQNAAARHAIEMRNQNARFHRENEELKARLEAAEGKHGKPAGESPRAADPEAPPPPPQVAELDKRLDSIRTEYEASEGVLAQEVKDLQKLRTEIAEIDEELEDPGPSSDVADLAHQKKRKVAKAKLMQERIELRDSHNQGLHDRFHALKPVRDQAAELHRVQSSLASEAEVRQQQAEAAEMRGMRTGFFKAAEDAAKELNMPADLVADFIGQDGYARQSALAFLVPGPDGRIPSIEDYLAFCKKAGERCFRV